MASLPFPRPLGPGAENVVVLSVSHLKDTHSRLRGIFQLTNWRLNEASSHEEALSILRRRPVGVVLCEDELPDGSWKELLASTRKLPDPPLIIVTGRNADDRLWGEVLNLGGYDLLAKPFDTAEVTRVISIAWLHWHNQRRPVERELRAAGAVGNFLAAQA